VAVFPQVTRLFLPCRATPSVKDNSRNKNTCYKNVIICGLQLVLLFISSQSQPHHKKFHVAFAITKDHMDCQSQLMNFIPPFGLRSPPKLHLHSYLPPISFHIPVPIAGSSWHQRPYHLDLLGLCHNFCHVSPHAFMTSGGCRMRDKGGLKQWRCWFVWRFNGDLMLLL